MKGNTAIIGLLILFAAMLALSQGGSLVPGSLTGEATYLKVTTPCGESFENMMLYEYYDTFHDRPADYYRPEIYKYETVPPIYGFLASGYLTPKGMMACEDHKFYNINNEPVTSFDFIYTYRYPQPEDIVYFNDSVDCKWISRDRLLVEGTTILNPIELILGECNPVIVPDEPVIEPPADDPVWTPEDDYVSPEPQPINIIEYIILIMEDIFNTIRSWFM